MAQPRSDLGVRIEFLINLIHANRFSFLRTYYPTHQSDENQLKMASLNAK